jgi:hypothetical protein
VPADLAVAAQMYVDRVPGPNGKQPSYASLVNEFPSLNTTTLRRAVDRLRSDANPVAKLGAPRLLTEEEDRKLAEWVKDSAERGFPLAKLEIQLAARDVLALRHAHWKRGEGSIPEDGWWEDWRREHDIIMRSVEQQRADQACVLTRELATLHFKMLADLCAKYGIPFVRIFNYDETAVVSPALPLPCHVSCVD